uniref:Uncharacterized protein n=1 Tax=Acrobeloides nanus TaxID=290746 RepID=A0A914CJ09_9BILA
MEELAKMLEERNFPDEERKYYEQKKLSLCKDVTYSGFLLRNASIDWPISCLWTYLKNQTFHAACAPTPSSYDVHDYIPPEKWSKMLKEFRTRIQCSRNQIEAVKEVINELNICRERCIDLGQDEWNHWIGLGLLFMIFWFVFMMQNWSSFERKRHLFYIDRENGTIGLDKELVYIDRENGTIRLDKELVYIDRENDVFY